ncbi:MAG: response regulator [Chitinophagaceae bacterium]
MKNNEPGKYTILWADDDQDDLMIMREVMHTVSSECEIIEVENGRMVMEYLQAAKVTNSFPCLVVLDMNMPIMSGRDTLAAIKADAVLSTLPLVVFTTSSSELDRLFCQRYGVDMLTKPLTFSGMRQVVASLFNICKISG